MTTPDDRSEDSPGHQLLVAGGAMLAVALVVGLVVGGAILGAVRVAGVGDGGATASDETPTLVVPEPTGSAAAAPEPSGQASPARRRPAPPIRLAAEPRAVGAGERITLSGAYPGGDGSALQVQRQEGAGWVDFPVEAQVSGDSFTTWVQTTRTGPTVFRVVDEATGKASNRVEVQVG